MATFLLVSPAKCHSRPCSPTASGAIARLRREGHPRKHGLECLRPVASMEALAVASDSPCFRVEASPISTLAFAVLKDEFRKSPSRSDAIHWQSTDDGSCRWRSFRSRPQRTSPSWPRPVHLSGSRTGDFIPVRRRAASSFELRGRRDDQSIFRARFHRL